MQAGLSADVLDDPYFARTTPDDAALDGVELAHLLCLYVRSSTQARKVLLAQARSGQSIVRFAKRYRLRSSRL